MSYQVESKGEPRYIEDTSIRVEDIFSAVNYPTTLDFVDENRIDVLDVYARFSYEVNIIMTEFRIKVVGTNIGRINRESSDPIKIV